MYRTATDIPRRTELTVRHAGSGDEQALAMLAALDSGPRIAGAALVAETDARIVAALPFGSGRPIADPFERTAVVVRVLRAQIAGAPKPRPRRRGWLGRLLPA